MSLAYYFDHNLASIIALMLRARGVDVLTAQDDGATRLGDETMLARATLLDRVLVTGDGDFLRIAAQWQQLGRDFPGLVFVPNQFHEATAVAELELIATVAESQEIRGLVKFIPI